MGRKQTIPSAKPGQTWKRPAKETSGDYVFTIAEVKGAKVVGRLEYDGKTYERWEMGVPNLRSFYTFVGGPT